MKISCIIPAYNEEKNIENIVSTVVPLIGKIIYEVIVIDDCSRDATKEIVKKFSEVKLLEKNINSGKSAAIADGIYASKGDYIFLLDADLKNLNEKNIMDIINPIKNDISDITLSYRKNAWPLIFSPNKDIDALTGERILPKKLLINYIKDIKELPCFGLEDFLNKIIIQNNMRISIVKWSNVENVFPQHKRGLFKGVKQNIKMLLNIFAVVSLPELYSQNIKLKKLLVSKYEN